LAILEVEGLKVHFRTGAEAVRAVDDVSFSLVRGETLAIVGESGSGKSVTANAVMRLLPRAQTRVAGAIRFDGRDLMALPERSMAQLRGDRIGMVFQEPMTSLNPVLSIGTQITETLRRHKGLTMRAALDRAVEMLAAVGISEPGRRIAEYPHQLSGGMRQRVMIAIAICCDPDILIADEPTTALDVTIQAQILDLLAELKRRTGTSIIFITHDLGVVAEIADRILVMYAGRKIEESATSDLFEQPMHPYTRGLLASMPRLRGGSDAGPARLHEIPGLIPLQSFGAAGCNFAERCVRAEAVCRENSPPPLLVRPGHMSACHFSDIGTASS